MDRETQQRVVGAIALMVLATVLIPVMFGSPQDPRATIQPSFTTPLAAELPVVPSPTAAPQQMAAADPVEATPLPSPQATRLPAATAAPVPTPTSAPTPAPTATPTPTPRPKPTTPPSEPPPRAKPLAPPAETAPPVKDAGHRWTVQVASYKFEDPAERLRNRLAEAGYDSFIVSKDIKGTRYYRVRVYVVGSEDQVMAEQGRIEQRYRVNTRRFY